VPFLVGSGFGLEARRCVVQKWEYASVPLIPHAIKEILDSWGDDGWELVQVYSPTDVPGTVAILKRPKES
jgi:hypothetical protein